MQDPKLNKAVLQLDGPKNKDVLLCIDFGTAFSKAAASNGSGYRPLLLRLGHMAEDPRSTNRYVAESSLFIDRNKIVHFGHGAVAHWARQRNFEIARLDSMKRWLSSGPCVDLDNEPVDKRFLPDGCALTKGEALTLLLAYITDLACNALVASKISRYVRRRFTRPVWGVDREHWCDELMARYLCRAQLIADSFSGDWREGIPLDDAREPLDITKAERLPDWLVDPKGVPEPIAAGHCRVEKDEQHRYLALVVDVGAGTTDLAVFTGSQGDGSVGLTRAIPQGKTTSLLMAGDYLDKVLQEAILESLPVPSRTDAVVREIEGRIRGWKEALFVDGVVQPTFAGGIVAPKMQRDDFIATPEVKRFTREIGAAIDEVFESVGDIANRMAKVSLVPLSEITVLASGGGAKLPMIKKLLKKDRTVGKYQFPTRDAGPAPSWFVQYYREEAEAFHQLAVAIGGAFPVLPGPPNLSRRPPRLSL